jgi:hypothetical protein
MDFKNIGLNHIWDDLRTSGEFRPMVMMVTDGHYRFAYPNLDGTKTKDILTCFAVMARSENAYQCLFFVEAEFQRGVEEAEGYRTCILAIHFHLRPEPTRAKVTCAGYKLIGTELEIGEELDKDTEGDPVIACFWEAYKDPNYWMMTMGKS